MPRPAAVVAVLACLVMHVVDVSAQLTLPASECSSTDTSRFHFVEVFVGACGLGQGSLVKMIELEPGEKLVVYCRVWTGLDAACPSTLAKFLFCTEQQDCEPIHLHDIDQNKYFTLYAPEEGSTWSLYFDSASLPPSCFPRRIGARLVATTETISESFGAARWVFVLMICVVTVVFCAVIAVNFRRIFRYIQPMVDRAHEHSVKDRERKREEYLERKKHKYGEGYTQDTLGASTATDAERWARREDERAKAEQEEAKKKGGAPAAPNPLAGEVPAKEGAKEKETKGKEKEKDKDKDKGKAKEAGESHPPASLEGSTSAQPLLEGSVGAGKGVQLPPGKAQGGAGGAKPGGGGADLGKTASGASTARLLLGGADPVTPLDGGRATKRPQPLLPTASQQGGGKSGADPLEDALRATAIGAGSPKADYKRMM